MVREGGLVIAQTSAEVWFPAVAGTIFGREPCSPRKPPSSWKRNMWVQVPSLQNETSTPVGVTVLFWDITLILIRLHPGVHFEERGAACDFIIGKEESLWYIEYSHKYTCRKKAGGKI